MNPLTPTLWDPANLIDLDIGSNPTEPRIIQLTNGNILVSWFDRSNLDVFGALYDPSGNLISEPFEIQGQMLPPEYRDETQSELDIVAAADGGFYSHFRQDADPGSGSPAVFVITKHSADGTPEVSQTYLGPDGGRPAFATIAYDSINDVVVIISTFNGGGDFLTIRRFDGNDLSGVGTPNAFNQDPSGTIRGLEVVALEEGGFVYTYGRDLGNARAGIFARKVNADGTFDERVEIYQDAEGYNSDPQIAALTDGGFVISFTRNGPDGDRDVLVEIVNADMSTRKSTFFVSITDVQEDQTEVIALADGSFVVIWATGGNNEGLVGQRYDKDGNTIGDQFGVNGSIDQIDGITLADGRVALAWRDGTDLKYEVFDLEEPNFADIIDLPDGSDPFEPRIIQLADGNVLVSWVERADVGVAGPVGFDVLGAVYDPRGNLISEPFNIVGSMLPEEYRNGAQSELDIVAAADGGFYSHFRQDAEPGSASAPLFVLTKHSATGTPEFSQTYLGPNEADGLPLNATLAYDSVNNVVATITTFDGGSNFLMIRQFDADNLAPGRASAFDQDPSDRIRGVEVVALEEGGFVYTYGRTLNGDRAGIFARKINADGTFGNSVDIYQDSQGFNTDPQIAALADGGFVISFTRTGPDGDRDVLVEIVNADMSTRKSTFFVSITDVHEDQTEVIALADGSFVTLWAAEGANEGLVGQRYDKDGVALGDQFRLNGSIDQIDGVTLEDGRFGLTWLEGTTLKYQFFNPGERQTSVGTEGDDVLDGLGLQPALQGLGGDDVFVITDIADEFLTRIDGGAGQDTLRFDANVNLEIGEIGLIRGIESLVLSEDAQIVLIDYELFETPAEPRALESITFEGAANQVLQIRVTGRNGSLADITLAGSGTVELFLAEDATGRSLRGSAFAEQIFGNNSDNLIFGNGGADLLEGGGGNDFLFASADAPTAMYGGEGRDGVSFRELTEGITASLQTGESNRGDLIEDVELLFGTNFDDVLTSFDSASGRLYGGNGNDELIGGASNDDLLGENGDDRLIGNDGDDELWGGAGADFMDGGGGIDTANFSGNITETGLTINLESGTTSEGDTLISIENVIGTIFDDTITGAENTRNVLEGGDGNDTLNGLSGGDRLLGEAGNDLLLGDNPLGLDAMSFEAQIFRAYQAVFGRAPDKGGYSAFLTEMRLGRTDQAAIIVEFVGSQEFINTYGEDLTSRQFIELLYENVLPGNEDEVGRTNFTNALEAGNLTRAQVVEEFANSAEFIQNSSLNLSAFHTSVVMNPYEGQVFRAYQAVFGREPDEGGFIAFTAALETSALTLSGIITEFVASEEFETTYGTDLTEREFVELLYTNVLPGNMDQQGRDDFTNALSDGSLTRAQVVVEFAESFEFIQATMDAALTFRQVIFADSQGDLLRAGAGEDVIFGGRGDDLFEYTIQSDEADLILDFTIGYDQIRIGNLGVFNTFEAVIAAASQVGLDTVIDFGEGRMLTLQNIVLDDLISSDFFFKQNAGQTPISPDDAVYAEELGAVYEANEGYWDLYA